MFVPGAEEAGGYHIPGGFYMRSRARFSPEVERCYFTMLHVASREVDGNGLLAETLNPVLSVLFRSAAHQARPPPGILFGQQSHGQGVEPLIVLAVGLS